MLWPLYTFRTKNAFIKGSKILKKIKKFFRTNPEHQKFGQILEKK
jgi:hypothetical protein